jgi:hypothetical protein
MMLAAALILAQATICTGATAALQDEAVTRAAAFDLAGAVERLDRAVAGGCAGARLPSLYLRGLLDAREAFRVGGSPESLEPVRKAVVELDVLAAGAPGPAQVARTVLLAAAAAAQSERDEMWLLIEHALSLESLQLEAGQPGAPILTAHEMAGELWLEVHRYEDARRFFARAADRVGKTPHVALGLARAAARLGETVTACAEYVAFSASVPVRDDASAEMTEARTFLARPECVSLPGASR